MTKTILTIAAFTALLCACSRPGHAGGSDAAPDPAANMRLPEPPAPVPLHVGWYTVHDDATETFQPCGEPRPLLVGSAELRAEARESGLAPGTPVYVRVRGKRDGSLLAIAGVEQFGSPTPVIDCPMGDGAVPAGSP